MLLHEFPTEPEAQLFAHSLADAGIPADVAGDPGVGLYAGYGLSARLSVPADRLQEARSLFVDYTKEAGQGPPGWRGDRSCGSRDQPD